MDIQIRDVKPFEQYCIDEFSMCHDDGDFERDVQGFYESVETERLWRVWELQASKANTVPEGFVLVSQDKAKDTDRLNFLLGDDRYIRTVVHRDIQNEDFEKIGEHYLFTEVYWIDGWDYHENSSSQSERGAIDKAMLESQEPTCE